jgi:hypothetical protein
VGPRLTAQRRLRDRLERAGGVVLALDGRRPDVGHAVLRVLRDGLTGEPLLARSLLSATETDLAVLRREVQDALPVPMLGGVSAGRHAIRRAVASARPGIPHRGCQLHSLREAAKPIAEADRHATTEPKKAVRRVRPLARAVAGRAGPAAEVTRASCLAVRSALPDDGRPPVCGSGPKLHARLAALDASLGRVAAKGACRPS